MYRIRQGAFETNSSSMHTIILAGTKTDNELDPLVENQNSPKKKLVIKKKDIDFSEYSTGRTLTTWVERLHYALAYCYDKSGPFNEDVNEINERFKEIVHKKYPDLIIEFPDLKGESYFINHQSHDTLYTFLDNNSLTIEDFIFNDKIIVFTFYDGVEDYEMIDIALRDGFKDLKTITYFESTYKIENDENVIRDDD